ncbi:MAG: aldo/keto reductase [Bacteroidota bacterium]
MNLPNHRMGLGLAALGRPGYINLGHAEDLNHTYEKETMEAAAHRVLDCAWAAGVRYFDTARSYGLGELFLGNWLRSRNISPQAVVIGSKWGYTYTANWQIQATHHEVKEHSLAVLDRQWKESQETLGAQLDLYQIHSATLDSGVLENTAVLNRLAGIKAEGFAIGLSVSGAKQAEVIARAMEVEIDGNRLFDAVQATYNLLETSVSGILQQAHETGVQTIIKEALANGRLTSRNDFSTFRDQRLLLDQLANRYSVGIDAIALAGVLAQPWVDTVLSGAATEDHLLSNLQALTLRWDEELADQLIALAEPSQKYWTIRKGLYWN